MLKWSSARAFVIHREKPPKVWLSYAMFLGFLGVLFLGLPDSAESGVFMFTDAHGTVHFTDRPQDHRYRAMIMPERGLALSPQATSHPLSRRELNRLIEEIADAQEVDPALVKAVVAAESNFQTNAISRAGALGLMQLMPETAAELGVEAPFEPSQNVRGGVQYLKSLLERYDALEHALAAYNAGPTTVDRYEGVPPYPETRAYVARVLRFYTKYTRAWPLLAADQ